MKLTNKALAALMIFALVISIAGTLISLNRIGELRALTGMQGANVTMVRGTASVALTTAAAITLRVTSVDFGVGQVNGSATTSRDFCNLSSTVNNTMGGNDFTHIDYDGDITTSTCVGFHKNYSFVIENTGNTQFTNVTMNASQGETGFRGSSYFHAADAEYDFKVYNESGGGCDRSSTRSGSMSTNTVSVCDTFRPDPSTKDSFAVRINMSLPENASNAIFSDNVEFYGNV
jgi:hypothetical protein